MSQPASAFLDIVVHHVNQDQLTGTVANAIRDGRRTVIANHNLHSLYLIHHDPVFGEFYRLADLVHADGVGIVWLSALSRTPLRREHRTTYVDWMPSLMAAASANRWRVFFVGSKPGTAARGAAKLMAQWPDLEIETAHGYFDAIHMSPENQRLLRRIRDYRPHILMVGMGMPKQERWIMENLADLDCNVVLPAGAAMDYVSGEAATPPRWAGRMGLEWLFRLMSEPKRLAPRYLIEPWYIARLVIAHYRGGFLRANAQ